MKPAKPGGSFQAAQGAAGTACIEIKDGENADDPKTPENVNDPDDWYDGKGGVCKPWYERTGDSPVLSAYPSPVTRNWVQAREARTQVREFPTFHFSGRN